MVNFLGDFLSELLVLPSNWFGTPQKSVQTSEPKILAKNPPRNPREKSGKKPCKKSGQKVHAKNA